MDLEICMLLLKGLGLLFFFFYILRLLDKKYSKNVNTMKYYYNLKYCYVTYLKM